MQGAQPQPVTRSSKRTRSDTLNWLNDLDNVEQRGPRWIAVEAIPSASSPASSDESRLGKLLENLESVVGWNLSMSRGFITCQRSPLGLGKGDHNAKRVFTRGQ